MSQEENEADKTNPEIEPEASEMTEEDIDQVTGGAGGVFNKTNKKPSPYAADIFLKRGGEERFKKATDFGDLKSGDIKGAPGNFGNG